MYFRLKCACGKDVTVPEGAAGVSLTCACGQRVVVPELTELRQRAAAGEIGCSLYAEGDERPPPPNSVGETAHGAFCWLVLLAGGLMVGVGVLLLIRYGRIGYYVGATGVTLMGMAAAALVDRDDLKAARRAERQEFARLTGAAHRSVGSPADTNAETSVRNRPPT